MTQPNPPENDSLEAAFSDMKTVTPDLPDGLMARVMADAVAQMPKPKKTPMWRHVISTLGGWPAVGGLVATACVGVVVGGVLTDDLVVALGYAQSASLDIGGGLGGFDLLLVDG